MIKSVSGGDVRLGKQCVAGLHMSLSAQLSDEVYWGTGVSFTVLSRKVCGFK